MTLTKLRILLSAGAFALSGCASTIDHDGALEVVPYRIEGDHRIVVDVRVNDQGPFPFALDTGSSITTIFDELRSELELESGSETWATIHGIVTSGRFRLFDISRVQIGGEIWSDPRVASLPGDTEAGANIDGILGLDFLRRYAVGFSTEERVVRLYPPDLIRKRSYLGWASVPLDPVKIGGSGATLYFFEIRIGGKSVRALLDLGAGLNIINWHAGRSLGLDPVRLRRDELLSGAVKSTPITARFNAKEITTAGIRWRNEKFTVADTEIFTVLPQGDSPLAILGFDFLSQRDFVIDFVRNRLLFYIAKAEMDEPS